MQSREYDNGCNHVNMIMDHLYDNQIYFGYTLKLATLNMQYNSTCFRHWRMRIISWITGKIAWAYQYGFSMIPQILLTSWANSQIKCVCITKYYFPGSNFILYQHISSPQFLEYRDMACNVILTLPWKLNDIQFCIF